MLVETTELIKHLLVYPQNMARNMNVYGGVVFSQGVMLALIDKGLGREEAYAIVQGCAHQAWNTDDGNFRALIEADERVQAHLSAAEVDHCFSPDRHLRHLDQVFQRLGI
jgi:adenylosuccinate lyase